VFQRHIIPAGTVVLLVAAITLVPQRGFSDESGQVLALETAWNHAIEVKDTKAMDMLLADSMIAVDSDGSFLNKREYLASIKAPDFQPSQAVNEKNDVHVYGDSAVAVGVFRIKEVEKGKTVIHRQRTVDTWVRMNGSWRCVAAVAITIPTNQAQ
jgi:ketosteroid isomerase-like protein